MIPTPFTNIALSLSGGGYRATTFHLGAMAYLNEQKFKGENLLENVKIISTISGGTHTGVMYALKLAQGEGFQGCFDKLYLLLSEDKLVDEALHKLNHPAKWKNKFKSRDVINAFAEVYDEQFFDEATFATLYDAPKRHLSDAIFGASEFTYGIQFRFQEEHGKAKFGNYYMNLPKEVSREIRLADATAASSCFPGGFEPMIMPHDFDNGPGSLVSEAWKSKSFDGVKYQTTGIMDGGIIDNQGIEGVMLAEKRHGSEEDPFIGTYLVSDVSGDMMKPYKVPVLTHNRFKNFFTVNTISIIALILIAVLSFLLYRGLPFGGIVFSSVIFTLIAIWFIVYITIHSALKNAIKKGFGESLVPEMMRDFNVLRKTPIYILLYLVKFRLSSVMKMVSDLFLRRIRRLQFDNLYAEKKWNYRFKSNYIYSLNKPNEKANLTPAMVKVVEAANSMPTTLWFSETEKKNNVLDELIACGQMTMCRNLSKYIDRIKTGAYKKRVWDELPADDKTAIDEMQKSLAMDWEKFTLDPYWLLKKNKENKKKNVA